MNKNEQTATMYESIPAVAELNKVPGFDPFKLLRRIISPENGEEMMQLDLRYKKLWFRLANPKGRIRLNALRITEQMAIYEAQVFLERKMCIRASHCPDREHAVYPDAVYAASGAEETVG